LGDPTRDHIPGGTNGGYWGLNTAAGYTADIRLPSSSRTKAPPRERQCQLDLGHRTMDERLCFLLSSYRKRIRTSAAPRLSGRAAVRRTRKHSSCDA